MNKRTDPAEVARRQREDRFGAFRRETEPAMRRIVNGRVNGGKHRVDPQVAVDEAYSQFERKYFDVLPENEWRARLALIVTRRAIDLVKRPKYTADLPEGDRDGRLGEIDDEIERAGDIIDAGKALEPVRSVIEALNEKQRMALQRVVLDGQEVSDVAREMDLSERRIRQLRDEALLRLRRKLGVPEPGARRADAVSRGAIDNAEGGK